jgi:superfamily II RNA helicase
MPTKTVIFTDVNKFDGSQNRILYSHEMMQMAGRAGRRGIDKVGNCFHLNNLFRNVDSVNYKRMMAGKPQTLTSKFKISFHLLLNLFSIGNQNAEKFATKSMVTLDLDSQKGEIYNKIQKINAEIDNIQQSQNFVKTPTLVIQEYIELKNRLPQLVNKKRKDVERQIQKIVEQYKTIEHDKKCYDKYFVKKQETVELERQLENTNGYIRGGIDNVLCILENNAFINKSHDNKYCLTLKGQIASQLKETHCLVFANLIESRVIDTLSSKQLVCFFSCFTNVNVKEDAKENNLNNVVDIVLKQVIEKTTNMYNQFQDEELKYSVNTGTDYSYHYDLLNYVDEWCVCENVEDCKIILQKMSLEKDIFLGEFVKAILKINNISCELEKIAEMIGNISFLSKLREISQMTMKFVVTNQSLYI